MSNETRPTRGFWGWAYNLTEKWLDIREAGIMAGVEESVKKVQAHNEYMIANYPEIAAIEAARDRRIARLEEELREIQRK